MLTDDLAARRAAQANLPHARHRLRCLRCGEAWLGVAPADVPVWKLECPGCRVVGGAELRED